MKISDFRLLKPKGKVDYWVALLPVLFSLFGLLMIFEASNVAAFRDFGDKYHYVKEQLTWFFVGITSMIILALLPYKKYCQWTVFYLIFVIIMLFSVFIPGLGIKALGASRWLKLGPVNFQPAELSKIVLIIYLSVWLSVKEKKRFLAFLLLIAMVVGLVILQPDLGTAIILTAIALVIYFISGAPLKHFLLLLPVIIAAVTLLAISSPYRFRRLTTFLDPSSDPLGASYHIRQVFLTLGSGGFFGVGLGGSKQKYEYLPEATTDSIFAIIGEEFGYFGAVFLIVLFLIFLYKIYRLAKNAPDLQSTLLAIGILALFAFQMIINLGSMVAVFPLTGIPLPFISYGGSSLVTSFVAVGLLLSIGRYSWHKKNS